LIPSTVKTATESLTLQVDMILSHLILSSSDHSQQGHRCLLHTVMFVTMLSCLIPQY